MDASTGKAYGYRWLVLAAYVLIAGVCEVLWITFAPVTGTAAAFYHTSDLMIGLLSMCFMVVYIPMFYPAAWLIDKKGFRASVGLGAVMTAVFGLARGIFASNFTLVFISQVGLAAAQPFIIGATTTIASRWFPVRERATATGLGTLALYLGPLVAMILTPALVLRVGFEEMLWIYGLAAALAAFVFLWIAREHPPVPPEPGAPGERILVFEGLKTMFRRRDVLFLMTIFFVGLGLFNAVSTWIEDIVRPRGFTISQAGWLGGLMLLGGIIGAIVMPVLSDKIARRKPFILIALAGLIPGLIGMTFTTSLPVLLAAGFVFGFFLLSAGPIGFQYAAEITRPIPEGASNTVLLLMGQVSGILFILAMDAFKSKATGSMTGSLAALTVMIIGSFGLALFLPESLKKPAASRP
ncbi:MAG TPA: MFS transporter [Candidatus Aminicenantes bacterium]|nr:MFS transporter [Candidatus Aminicenantes bacterium]HOS11967.1 MFS transporter [Candidatus Aminicenantes bacterium]HOU48555.1 MFS transporter [Candidatus Aminicenantes bacterium]HPL14521.1 MFS transporter [Candidatus Aminicenantes bacterium]HQF96905.1 MFS transporter [Candidatus Aminicenantes bacterium]